MKVNYLIKKQKFGKKVSVIDRFNVPTDESNFLKIFQAAMKEKLMLVECGEYDPIEFNRFLNRKFKRETKYFDLKIKPLLLSCKVGPEFYLEIQEAAKRVFGDYVAIDSLIIFLFDYFVENYGKENSRGDVPLLIRKYAEGDNSRLKCFNAKFSKFYKNHVVSFRN